ncbi:MAG: TIGR03936 family radical SAM-associated protein [Dehalococcoidia bacterium]|nr:TIGR03936 family radical SAM-associated protein [Dehalococcoidia bacterium]
MKRYLSSKPDPQQRVRVTFSRSGEVKYITHLDIMRLWQRALRRAGMPLTYSQGFNPHPRISIAAPLAIGVTSEGELMDLFFDRRVSLEFFTQAVGRQLPVGVSILGAKELWPGLPSLQSQLRFSEYRVEVESDKGIEEVAALIRSLLGKVTLPWQHARGEDVHRYDLRALIDDVWIIDRGESCYTLGMRLCSDGSGSGRPEQVILAMGISGLPRSVHRTKLVFGAG